jgi:Mor family transcriptional regulator
LDWLNEIEIKDLLSHDSLLIAEHCGMSVLVKLWEGVPNLSLYISTKPLIEAKKRYIKKFFNGANVKQIALKLEVSERFVYEVIANTEEKDNRQGKLI